MVSDEMVEEATARALCRLEYPDSFEEWVSPSRQRWQRHLDEARAILKVVAPLIRAEVIEECHDRIMAAVPVSPPADQAESMYRMGLREAARLVTRLAMKGAQP